MTPEEIAAAHKWVAEEKWTKLSPYGRAVVEKLINEVERLQAQIALMESPSQELGILEDW